ncbi:EAL domain-containing protein [Acetobacter sp.]|uniref:EAL domain-containing protein n=1 Tax=Acetobacter sp. TaxID=440 RepID=UPI0039E9BD50
MSTSPPILGSSQRLRARLRSLLPYALPVLTVVSCGAAIEVHDYYHARTEVAEEALRDSQAYASLIADRLNTRFTELDVASAELLAPHANPAAPSPQVEEALRRYLLSRSSPHTFNVLSPDGETIQWSTAPLVNRTVSKIQDFSSLPHSVDHLLGRVHLRDGTKEAVLPMRVHGDTDDHAGYFLASPYPLNRLLDVQELPSDYRQGWSFTLKDNRDGTSVSRWLDPRGGEPAAPVEAGTTVVSTPVGDYPFSVEADIAPSRVWRTYEKEAPSRWGVEALAFAVLLTAGVLVIRRREREQMQHLTRLTEFNSFMAQINQCVSQAVDEETLLREICDMAIHYAHLKIAFIGRPDESKALQILAVGGPPDCMKGVSISIDPNLPEGRGSVGRVWRGGQPIFNASFTTTEYTQPWQDWAMRQGVRSNAVLPIYRDRRVWAVLSVYHEQAHVFDSQLQALLREISADISNGLEQLYNRRLQKALLDNSVVGILLVRDRVIQMTNTRVAQMLGVSPDSFLNQSAEMLYADRHEYDRVGGIYEQLRAEGEVRVTSVRLSRPDGRIMIADFSGVQLRDLNGNVSVWTIEDVTSRDVAQRLYHALINTADAVLQASSDTEMCDRACADLVQDTLFHAVWIGQVTADDRISVVAHAGEGTGGLEQLDIRVSQPGSASLVAARAWNQQTLAYSNDELGDHADAPWYDFLNDNQWRAVLATPIWRGGSIWAVISFVSPQAMVFDAQSIALCQRVAQLLGHALDTLDAKQRVEKLQVEESLRARHDLLTGLPNRLALEEYMPQALARARRRGTAVGVCMLDLDDFKIVNDSYGHEAGDRLLQELAARVQLGLRQTDYVARLGGDEFVVILEDLDALLPVTQATTVLNQLHVAVETPFQVRADAFATVGMTLGLAFYPLDGDDPDSLLRRADAAMYQSKETKATRKTWWCLASATSARQATDSIPEPVTFNAYGPEAAELLTRAKTFLTQIRQDFVERFYEIVWEMSEGKRILSSLSPEKLERLKQRQVAHLGFLLAPDTTQKDIVTVAERLGEVHALSGMGAALLSESYSIYRRLLIDSLDNAMLRAYDRYHILLTTEIRLQDDKGTQLEAGQAIEQAYFSLLSDPLPAIDSVWPDASARGMEDLARLPGIQAVLLFRMDPSGHLVVEGSAGSKALDLIDVLKDSMGYTVFDTQTAFGQSVTAMAWRTRQRQSCASYAQDSRLTVWRDVMERLGISSSISIPIKQEEEQVAAVLTVFGVYPSQFESLMMQQFARGLQRRWEQVLQRCYSRRAPAVTEERSCQLRERLFSGGLRMYVQPVVNLRTGALLEVEALARLQDENGEIISPAVFLPLLGRNELDRLFHLGLEQILARVKEWDGEGLGVSLAINMPPTYLLNAEGPRWVGDTLRTYGMAASRLTIELLETQSIDPALQSAVIQRFKALGVRVAIDDLGSGYSSLLRLSSLPFDIIKIDQGLLKHIRRTPLQTFSMVKSVLDMGADFRDVVVAEGLEDDEVIEAIRHLGGTYGQGYGIARPMPDTDFPAWYRAYRAALADRTAPANEVKCALGALAYHWMATRGGQDLTEKSVDDCPITRWLAASGLVGSQAAHWHDQCHRGPAPLEASRRFTEWLLEQIVTSSDRQYPAITGT